MPQLNTLAITFLISLGLITPDPLVTVQKQQVEQFALPQLTQAKSMLWVQCRGRSGTDRMPMQIFNEFDYLSQMIPHHLEAIATAQQVLERSNRPELKKFAQTMIDVQSAEIKQMQYWLGAWYSNQPTTIRYTPMMRNLMTLSGDDLDQAFLEDMIRHHHMAVMMSHRLINHRLMNHLELRPFAKQIVSSQTTEIYQMQDWLYEWFGVTRLMPGMGRIRMR